MDIFKVAVSSLIIASTSAFAGGNFHMGAKVAGTYNMFWNTDITIDAGTLGISSEQFEDQFDGASVKINGLDDAGGLGVDFGLTFMLSLSNSIALAPELLFSYRNRTTDITAVAATNSRDNSVYTDDDVSYTFYYNNENSNNNMFTMNDVELTQWYLEIPVLLRFTTGVGVYLGAGPVFSLNLDTDGKASIFKRDIDDYTTTLVIGLAADVGYSLKIAGSQQLDFGLRFQMGLTNIVSDDISVPEIAENYSIDGTKIANPKDLIISLGVGYWFL